jgi:PhzF family phenazine biosynthesis protein
MARQVYLLRVFAAGPKGGNPLPVVVDALDMSDKDMQAIAATHGHESGFVFPAPESSECDFEFRFWVPEHEMEMCGHATVGAVWLLEKLNRLPRDHVRILTKSGVVEANVTRNPNGTWIEISQSQGLVETVLSASDIEELLSVLGISIYEIAHQPIQNSSTSRVKTLIPLKSVDRLNSLRPQFHLIKQLCERIGSTGLYPYAVSDQANQIFEARQFPKSSGYNEDAATGIAASALAYGVLENEIVGSTDRIVKVRQGWAMGCPSEITVGFKKQDGIITGCWIGGTAILESGQICS